MILDQSSIPTIFFVLFVLGVVILALTSYFTRIIYVRNKLLTDGEMRFYKLIREYIDPYYDFYIQVRLASIVTLPSGYFLWKHFSPINNKTVDFVICDKQTGKTLLVLELDDRTHRLAKRRRRDQFVNNVLKQAGIPILRITVKRDYNLKMILSLIKRRLEENQI